MHVFAETIPFFLFNGNSLLQQVLGFFQEVSSTKVSVPIKPSFAN